MSEDERILRIGGRFDIACRVSGNRPGKAVVFIHGFGSAKEHFRHAFDSPFFEGFLLAAIDLVGFGRSRGPATFGYGMDEQARVMLSALDELEIKSFHLVAHSMGGLVGMNMAAMAPGRVLSFVDLEGNLLREDCFMTGRVAGMSMEDFIGGGREELEREFAEAGQEDSVLLEYLETFSAASGDALYKSAVHTVEGSTSALVDRLSRMENACYIYGERNMGVYPAEKLLQASGVPLFYIAGAGHSMATENPEALYRAISAFIAGLETTGT